MGNSFQPARIPPSLRDFRSVLLAAGRSEAAFSAVESGVSVSVISGVFSSVVSASDVSSVSSCVTAEASFTRLCSVPAPNTFAALTAVVTQAAASTPLIYFYFSLFILLSLQKQAKPAVCSACFKILLLLYLISKTPEQSPASDLHHTLSYEAPVQYGFLRSHAESRYWQVQTACLPAPVPEGCHTPVQSLQERCL